MTSAIANVLSTITQAETAAVAASVAAEPTPKKSKAKAAKETTSEIPPNVSAAISAIKETQVELAARFFERDDVIRSMMLAAAAGEHLILLGPPGTAKSELARAFSDAIDGNFFGLLLTRFTTPDEYFGPLSVRGLQEDKLLRKTANRLPEANVAFLDEVFKANSAALNGLLHAINERTYEQDGESLPMPLRVVVAASNEIPSDADGLGAFYDRFLFRHLVKPLQERASIDGLFFDAAPVAPMPRGILSIEALDTVKTYARAIPCSTDFRDAVVKIREALAKEGIEVSDRRWKKIVLAMRVDAVLRGRTTVNASDLSPMRAMLWSDPANIAKVAEIIKENQAKWVTIADNARQVFVQFEKGLHDARRKQKQADIQAALVKPVQLLEEGAKLIEQLQAFKDEEATKEANKLIERAMTLKDMFKSIQTAMVSL